jgi:hypothetical protein
MPELDQPSPAETGEVIWVGPADVHDAHIRDVARSEDGLTVTLETCEGAELVARFEGVEAVREQDPVGMMIYGLFARDSAGESCFSFSNWDEDDPAFLEVIAAGVTFELHGSSFPQRTRRQREDGGSADT